MEVVGPPLRLLLRISPLCAQGRDCGGHGPSPAACNEDLCPLVTRGEIVEDVDPPLRLDTPLLLVKPPVGLSTPAVFRALDLARRSQAEPLQVIQSWLDFGMTQSSTSACHNA